MPDLPAISETPAQRGFRLQEHVPLAPFTTFGIGGPARWFAAVSSEHELARACAWASVNNLPLFILGGGSNILVADAGFQGLVVQIALRGIEELPGSPLRTFRVAAGEPWDAFVTYSVERDCAGIECLAGIPGTVGGTPVQNVGAYGQEVSQTITQVHCFDRRTGGFVCFSGPECGFAYRSSRFNTGRDKERYVVTRVDFQLQPNGQPTLTYVDLQRYFEESMQAADLKAVAAAIREIRARKGMVIPDDPLANRDPDTRSAGSFFKNPIVPLATCQAIAAAAHPGMPSYPAPALDGIEQRKLSAAWLLEHAGFPKGFAQGNAALSSKHTLALTNRSGNTSSANMLALRDTLIAGVLARFGVRLEQEPILIG